jgi:hypothetical protein
VIAIPSEADFIAAVTWRTDRVPRDALYPLASAAFRVLGKDECHPSEEKHLEEFLDSLDRTDRRHPEGLRLALCAIEAYREGDLAVFYRAAAPVLDAWRQSQRQACRGRHSGSFDALITAYARDAIEPAKAWLDVQRRVADHCDEFLWDFTEGVLTYETQVGVDREIDFAAFRKRLQRKRIELRQQPVDVAATTYAVAA